MSVLYNCISFLLLFTVSYCEDLHRRYEDKYSFKGPYLSQKDKTVPFWEYGGHAIASADRLRITPSLKSQKGYAWTKNPIDFRWWTAEIIFRIIGERSGADGMALWYTANKGIEGPVFGSSDSWNGFGLFFDSFDNDQKRNNPYIMGMLNDGSQVYQHESDGFHQKMGGCLRNFRNKAFPVHAKVEYYNNVLTVMIHNGDSDIVDYEICFRSDNVYLPASGYFGISGATGGLADDQDVLKFLVHSVRPMSEMAGIKHTEDYEKYQREYKEYEEKTQKARDEYLASHPEARPPDDESQFLTPDQMMFNQLTESMLRVRDDVRECLAKVDLVLGKQERTMSLVSGGMGASTGQVNQRGQLPGGSPDVFNNLLVGQRDLLQNIRDLKCYNEGDTPRPSQSTTVEESLNVQDASQVDDELLMLLNEIGIKEGPGTPASPITPSPQTPSSSSNTHKKRKINKDPQTELLNKAVEKLSKADNEDPFGDMVVFEINAMDPDQKMMCKKFINEVIFLGKCKAFKRTSKCTFTDLNEDL